MAVLKLFRYKNQADYFASTMKTVMEYCLRPEKTEQSENVFSTSGQNCSPQIAYEQFLLTKETFGKANGVFFRHYVQSFDPRENITPAEATKIAEEFADRAWHGYQVLIATHTDRQHIHTHFVINNVHPDTGKKLVEHPDNIENLRKISDEICRAHGLSTLPPYEGQRSNTMGSGEYRSAKRRDSWKIRLRKAIGQAMEWSFTREEFIENMDRLGYGVRWEDSRKNITYTCRNEPKYKDGSYRKCNDDKLLDDKYLKGDMEYEFTIRKEIFFGGFHDRRKYRNAGADPDGFDHGSRLDETATDDQAARIVGGSREHRAQDDIGGRREIPLGDEESGARAERGGEGSDPETDGNFRATGWERERESLARHRTPNDSRRVPVGTSPRSHGSAHGVGAVSGGLFGLASAASVIDNGDPDETEEEKKEREAREVGSVIGAGIGIILGAVTARKAPQHAENTNGGQVPDEEETPAEADNEDETAFEISM